MRFASVALGFALVTAGCASGGTTGSSSGARSSAVRDPNVITAAELEGTSYNNLYDAIRNLRPAMLVLRSGAGSSSISNQSQYVLSVYRDGVKLDGISDLKDYPVSGVHEIRYLSATDATQRYGTGNSAGAIVITSH